MDLIFYVWVTPSIFIEEHGNKEKIFDFLFSSKTISRFDVLRS